MSELDDGVDLDDLEQVLAGLNLDGSNLDFAESDQGTWSAPVAVGDRSTSVYVSVEHSSAPYDDPFLIVSLPLAGQVAGRPFGQVTSEALLTVNELNRDPGTKYRLVEGDGDAWTLVCEKELKPASTLSEDVQTAVQRLIDADAMTGQVVEALGQPEPEQQHEHQSGADDKPGDKSGLCSALILVLLAAFAGIAYYYSGHQDGAITGPAAPAAAHRPPPATVEAVALSHGFPRTDLKAAPDSAAPGGPVWIVYEFKANSAVKRAIAIDGRTYRVVTSYKRLKGSGGFRYLDVAMTKGDWVAEGILLALTLLLLPVWARRSWGRTLQLLFSDTGRVSAWLARCAWGLAWLFTAYVVGELITRAVQTGSPANRAAAGVYTVAVVAVWTVAGVAVMRQGAQETEAQADALAADAS